MNKKTIGVFCGSRSPEHDISIITGQLVINGLKGLGHNVVPVYLDKQGQWFSDEALGSFTYFKDGSVPQKYGGWYIDTAAPKGKLVLKQKGWRGKEIVIDIVFPAFHGANGEDGTAQGLFEMLEVPYVGCDVTSSAVTMDKVLTKLLYQQHNIATTPFVWLTKAEWQTEQARVTEKTQLLTWPLFVKPARLGSSIAVKKVKDENELIQAVEVALQYDHKVIIEESVEAVMDVTCCVVGDTELQASVLQEATFDTDLFDFDAKYLKGGQIGKADSGMVIPARLDEQTTRDIQEAAKQIFSLFGCHGIARVDFLYNKDTKQWFANELNTMPGTLYHHLWKASGVETAELLQKLVQFAEARAGRQKDLVSTFSSSVLSSLGGAKSGKLQ